MDKNTLSNYGWIVIAVLVLAVMIALATPFGGYIKTGVENTTQGLFDTSEKAMNIVGMSAGEGSFSPKMLEGDGQVLNAKKPVAFSFRSSAPVDTFEAVKVDGETVASENYTVTEGSTIVTFTEQYAQTLAEGSHSIEIVSNDGYGAKSATATFSVETPVELTTLTVKTWKGLTDFDGEYVWTDGTNTYYSRGSKQYILNDDTWEPKIWNGLTSFSGRFVWTDGTNTYYSNTSEGSKQYVLNGDTWEPKTWNGYTYIDGRFVWTDGTNTYYSYCKDQYVLNGDTWKTKTWNGFSKFGDTSHNNIYFDGTNTYYLAGPQQYVFNKTTDTWEPMVWKGLNTWTNIEGRYLWTDGTYIYYSYGSKQYILNGDTWEPKTWNGLTSFSPLYYNWTDGTNIYFSSGTYHYVFS